MNYSGNSQESSDSSVKNYTFSHRTGTKAKFRFPSPPRLTQSANNSYNSTNSDSSKSSASSLKLSKSYNLTKRRRKPKFKKLQPLGIYWDIENCQVPKNKSASALVQKIRQTFLEAYYESEFVVVCDVKKESSQVIQELHDAQVMLVHVSSTSKNAADEKLRQSLRRFGELHPAPSAVVLISGDINFASDLSDLRYRRKIRVILVHNVNAADALILCANEHHSFTELIKDIPENKIKTQPTVHETSFLTVTNLPKNFDVIRLKNRLRFLIENCGGKIFNIDTSEGSAVIKFSNLDNALRAQRRVQGEDVFGNKIKTLSPIGRRNYASKGQKLKQPESLYHSYEQLPPPGFFTTSNQKTSRAAEKSIKYPSNFQLPQVNGVYRPFSANATPMEIGYEYQLWGKNPEKKPSTRIHKSSGSSEFASDDQRLGYFHETSKAPQGHQVDLTISNLDPNVEYKELKQLLRNMLKDCNVANNFSLTTQADGTPIVNLTVQSQQEAQYVISQLHKRKLGHKRILISYAQSASPYPEELKAMVVELLQELPDQCMPLFRLIYLLELKYNYTTSISEINKLKDICKIDENSGSRIISLNRQFKTASPASLSRVLSQYCTKHCSSVIENRSWSELNVHQFPNVRIDLRSFADKLGSLLRSHDNFMHLMSFQTCYEQEFFEPLPAYDDGVPLEHLVTCVPNVVIKLVGPNKNIKIVTVEENKKEKQDEEGPLKSVPPSLVPNIFTLCRELVDLLKTQEKCQLLMSKFIPAYHRHFGKQCKLADYGYAKLVDLFESIPHVIQVLNDGTKRTITLTHSTQMRRFTADLLRVLKVQPAKQIVSSDFPSAYEKVNGRSFNAVDYGLCTFEDLLQEVPENTVLVSRNEAGELFVAIPRREQTPEEMVKTKEFALEVIDLLQHSPYYSILFDKFIPAYHHNFGHQCKVSNYGFSKLIELFEAIPDIVKIEEMPDGEKVISLTLPQALKVLRSQLMEIVRGAPQASLPVADLLSVYLKKYSFPLKPQMYKCGSINELLSGFSDYFQLINNNGELLIVAINVDDTPNVLSLRCWGLLLKEPHCMDLETFKYQYQSKYNSRFLMDGLQQIGNVISISLSDDINYIALTKLYILSAQLYQVIYKNDGKCFYAHLEKLYEEYYGKPLKLTSYDIYSICEFYEHFNLMFFIKGRKNKEMVLLNKNLADHFVPLPSSLCNKVLMDTKSNFNFPPPPSLDMVFGTKKKSCPPKPDTPPSPQTTNCAWNHWTSTNNDNKPHDLSIQLPIILNPKLLGNPYSLISPCRTLQPSMRHIWNDITSPDPAELPLPEKLIQKGSIANDSADSGVNIKLDNSPSDNENDAGPSNNAAGRSEKSSYRPYLLFSN
ncbi:unnamed protein product [Phyllotreta striolata]|uniref:HTH OST-type domain-containing protein n=1 Tax=Phyllotreta striolata TaxID=444603 RepID=A0A9N9TWA5_PHYSR|nr:unnamed protein product [Phyllotreta striolata]